jgi:hypothetical protein
LRRNISLISDIDGTPGESSGDGLVDVNHVGEVGPAGSTVSTNSNIKVHCVWVLCRGAMREIRTSMGWRMVGTVLTATGRGLEKSVLQLRCTKYYLPFSWNRPSSDEHPGPPFNPRPC